TDVDGLEQDGASDLNDVDPLPVLGKRIQPSPIRTEGDMVRLASVHRYRLQSAQRRHIDEYHGVAAADHGRQQLPIRARPKRLRRVGDANGLVREQVALE